MEIKGHTIIITTPDDLMSLIIEALSLAGYDKNSCQLQCNCEQSNLNRGNRKLLSPKDVEDEYGLSRKTLSYWRLEGMGPPFSNCGKLIYYERAEIENFIKATKINTTGYVK